MRHLLTCAAMIALSLGLTACGSDSSSPTGTADTVASDTAGGGATTDTGAPATSEDKGSTTQTDPGPAEDLAAVDPGPASVDEGPAAVDPGPAAVDEGPASTDPGQTARPTWENGIGDIFDNRCAGCHGWAGSYAGVAAKIDRVKSKVSGGHKVSGADKEAMLSWIEGGHPEK